MGEIMTHSMNEWIFWQVAKQSGSQTIQAEYMLTQRQNCIDYRECFLMAPVKTHSFFFHPCLIMEGLYKTVHSVELCVWYHEEQNSHGNVDQYWACLSIITFFCVDA